MRSLNLLVIVCALCGIIPPLHTARAQAPVPSGTVITVAGNGMFDFSGDNGPALNASFRGPTGLAVGPDGALYVADSDNFRIRAVNPVTGIITTVAGNGTFGDTGNDGPATDATLSSVVALATDRSRNALYFGDVDNNWVRKVDLATGTVTRYAGVGPTGFGFSGDGGPATGAEFLFVNGVATDAAGRLSTVDVANGRVRRVDPVTGIIDTIAGNGGFTSSGDDGPAPSASFESLSRIAADAAGNVFVIDTLSMGGSRIRRIDAATGIITRVAGGGDDAPTAPGPATSFNLGNVNDIAVDSANSSLYIASGHRVFRVDLTTGQLGPFAGTAAPGFGGDGGPASAATFNDFIQGLTAAPGGGLIISDSGNHRIRYVAPESVNLSGDSGQTAFYLPWVSSLSGEFTVTANPNLTTVSGAALTSVGGDVDVSGNTAATNIDLGSLTSARSVDVTGNTSATNIDVGALASTTGGVEVSGNTKATNIDLPALGTAASVDVSGNTAATNIGLPVLSTAGSVDVTGNTSATNIDLGALTTTTGEVDVSGNTAATGIDLGALTTAGAVDVSDNISATGIDLSALSSVSGRVNVAGNTAATGINLSSLTTAGAVDISGNTSATGIDLGSLTGTTGAVEVSGNTAATGIDLGSLSTSGGSVTVVNNTSAGSIDLHSLATVNGDFVVSGNSSASTMSFGSLTSVDDNVSIVDNTSVTSLSLGSLSTVGGTVSISGNTSMLGLDLGSLPTVGGNITIIDNDSMTSLNLDSLGTASGNVIVTDNESMTSLNLDSLATADGNVGVNDNDAMTSLNLSSLATVTGDITVTDNDSMTSLNLDNLATADGNVSINDNTSLASLDLGSLSTSGGSLTVANNTSAGTIDLHSFTTANGDFVVSGNTSVTSLGFGSLSSVDGSVSIDANTSATGVELSALDSVSGSVSIDGNTSATGVDLSSLDTVGGTVSIDGNTSATGISLGELQTVGGSVSIDGNTSATGVDLGSLETVAGDLTVTNNAPSASVTIGPLSTVSGDLTLETSGAGTLDLGGADVAGDTNLTADGYTTVDAATAGGSTGITMINNEATMEVTLPDGAFTSQTPVAFSITSEPGSTEIVDGNTVTHLGTYSFEFAIPTLNSPAELNFEIDLAAMMEPDRLVILDLLHTGALLTLGVRGDAPGAELQLFDVCSGGGPVADSCAVVQWLDESRMLLDPLGGIDPAILRLEGLVGHFSTYSFLAVILPGDYNFDGVVDAADYVVWRKADGTPQGYDTWRANVGAQSLAMGAGSGFSSNTTIPEPNGEVMLLIAAAGFGVVRRRW